MLKNNKKIKITNITYYIFFKLSKSHQDSFECDLLNVRDEVSYNLMNFRKFLVLFIFTLLFVEKRTLPINSNYNQL